MPSLLPVNKGPVTPESERFWDGIQNGEFRLNRCNDCGTVIWYPRRTCNVCLSRNLTEFTASGRGSIYTFTINRRGEGSFKESAPYVLCYVELEEGPRVLTNLVDSNLDDVAIGKAVEVVYEKDDSGWTIYRFKLV